MIPIYTGFDAREEVGWHTFASSVIERASEPVALVPLSGKQGDGSNAFTYARFMVPELQRYKGWAIFADGSDMVCKADIAELWALRDPAYAVQVVKHEYKTKHPRKYVGTPMETDNRDYRRKNWSSLMLMNCEHDDWRKMYDLSAFTGAQLHGFDFLDNRDIGELPADWNWLVDEFGENEKAKILHWTAGIPAWEAYEKAPQASDWWKERQRVTFAA